ncbi:MAG TPA: hypothetical protein DHV36_11190 [Desulfobacteraceae bacterium]|nr:hypothetical protein [Desulfobacteraceae bacterium]
MKTSKLPKRVYGVTLLFITLSGFGQMPIFKRYYIADITGFGWLAQFYITHSIHYITAAVLLAMAGYWTVSFLIEKQPMSSLTHLGRVKAGLILGLVVTGGLMVVKNLAGVYFSHAAIHLMDLLHLGLCMALLAVSGISLFTRTPWMRR